MGGIGTAMVPELGVSLVLVLVLVLVLGLVLVLVLLLLLGLARAPQGKQVLWSGPVQRTREWLPRQA